MINNSLLRIVLKGWGVAGRARFQAIENDKNIECLGVVSRREEFATLSWNQALNDTQVEAIAISTENTDHAKSVREALKANKHVICDYPLALNYGEAAELFDLAKIKQRVLHVEHIGLLTEAHRKLKNQIKSLGSLQRGEYIFQGGWNEKLADSAYAGPPYLFALSRLLQVGDLLGPFEIEVKEYHIHEKGFRLHLHLKFPQGGVLGFTEERQVALPRRRSLQFQCSQGNVNWKPTLKKENLFGQDLKWFYQRLRENKACYYDEALMLDILKQLDDAFGID
ncbi:MAG: Gfo/Idh/MocA family oxidoreductase [Deltaproteobacteria bacterium]|nr:Gfo/Idh/MocA family oxidoreductase [Deltaproteobacteria bacterium]